MILRLEVYATKTRPMILVRSRPAFWAGVSDSIPSGKKDKLYLTNEEDLETCIGLYKERTFSMGRNLILFVLATSIVTATQIATTGSEMADIQLVVTWLEEKTKRKSEGLGQRTV